MTDPTGDTDLFVHEIDVYKVTSREELSGSVQKPCPLFQVKATRLVLVFILLCLGLPRDIPIK